jgi:hypothetical protein
VETRIRRNIIILVVVTFLVMVGMSAGWFFLLVSPQNEEYAAVEGKYTERKQVADKLKTALEQERQAKDKLEYLKGQAFFFRGSDENRAVNGLYRRLYFGEIDGDTPINERARQEAWRAWMNEYHYTFGPQLRAELLRIAGDQSAPVSITISDIKVDDPPQMPEDVKGKIPANGLLEPLSATNNGELDITITGPFPNIVRFLERLNRSSFLMVVGQIKLEGHSPGLKASFKLKPYLVASGKGAKLTAGAAAAPAPAGDPAAAAAPADPGAAPAEAATTVRIRNPRFSQQGSAR